jgi:drug/metabolite transporter (DMT)-like permease
VLFRSVLLGASTLLIKRPIEKIGVDSSLLVRYSFSSVLTFLLAFAFGGLVLPSMGGLWLIVLGDIAGGIAVYFFFRAVGRGLLSIVDPFARTYAVLTILIAVAAFGETLGVLQVAGGALVLVSAIALAFNDSKAGRLEEGAGFALVTILGWGLFFVILKLVIAEVGAFSAAFYTEFGVFLLLLLLLRPHSIRYDDSRSAAGLFAGALALSVSSVLYNYAVLQIGVSAASLIAVGTPAVVVTASAFLFKERIQPYKYLALAGMVLGLALVSM